MFNNLNNGSQAFPATSGQLSFKAPTPTMQTAGCINDQVNRLHNNLDNLMGVISKLEERLTQVLSGGVSGNVPPSATPSYPSGLANTLGTAATRTEDCAQRLAELIMRIDL